MITRGPSFSLEIWLRLDSKSISPNPSGGGGNDGKLAHYFLLNYVEQVGLFRQFQVSLHTCRRERTRSIDALVYSALTSYRSFCPSVDQLVHQLKISHSLANSIKAQPITSIKSRKNWKNSVSNSSRLFLYFRIRAGRFFCVPTGRLWMCPCVICQKRRWPLISQSTSALLVVYFFSRAGPAIFFLKDGNKGPQKKGRQRSIQLWRWVSPRTRSVSDGRPITHSAWRGPNMKGGKKRRRSDWTYIHPQPWPQAALLNWRWRPVEPGARWRADPSVDLSFFLSLSLSLVVVVVVVAAVVILLEPGGCCWPISRWWWDCAPCWTAVGPLRINRFQAPIVCKATHCQSRQPRRRRRRHRISCWTYAIQ